jgi:hypothetical protein
LELTTTRLKEQTHKVIHASNMSFLYKNRKPARGLSNESDDDVQNVDFFQSSNKKSKVGSGNLKRPTESTAEESSKKKVVIQSLEDDEDNDDETESRRRAALQYKQLYESTTTKADVFVLDDSPPQNQQTPFTPTALTQTIQSIKEKMTKRQTADTTIIGETLDLSVGGPPKVQVRKVLTAEERQKKAEEMAKKLNANHSSSQTKSISSVAQLHDSGEDDDDEERVEIRTRLGTHDKKWKVKPDDKFTKVRAACISLSLFPSINT